MADRTADILRGYAQEHNLDDIISEILIDVLRTKPEHPITYIAEAICRKSHEVEQSGLHMVQAADEEIRITDDRIAQLEKQCADAEKHRADADHRAIESDKRAAELERQLATLEAEKAAAAAEQVNASPLCLIRKE